MRWGELRVSGAQLCAIAMVAWHGRYVRGLTQVDAPGTPEPRANSRASRRMRFVQRLRRLRSAQVEAVNQARRTKPARATRGRNSPPARPARRSLARRKRDAIRHFFPERSRALK